MIPVTIILVNMVPVNVHARVVAPHTSIEAANIHNKNLSSAGRLTVRYLPSIVYATAVLTKHDKRIRTIHVTAAANIVLNIQPLFCGNI